MYTDIYTRNGSVVRQRELGDGVCEVEMKFLGLKREEALVHSLAVAYLAFRLRRKVDFVICSSTRQIFAVRAEDLDEATHQALVDAVLAVRRHAATLLADAEIYYFGRSDKGALDTDPAGRLAQHKEADFVGARFLEVFAADIGFTGAPAAG